MCDYKLSARVTLYGTRFVMLVMLILLFCFPKLIHWYHTNLRTLPDAARNALLFGFYSCSLPVFLAMWNMDCLLRNILQEQLFTMKNVQHIRIIRWCCLAVSIFCLLAAFGFPALVFLFAIMAFLCLAVTVVGQVLKAAVAIREENDLTV